MGSSCFYYYFVSLFFSKGKFIRINFDKSGFIAGANIETSSFVAKRCATLFTARKQMSIENQNNTHRFSKLIDLFENL